MRCDPTGGTTRILGAFLSKFRANCEFFDLPVNENFEGEQKLGESSNLREKLEDPPFAPICRPFVLSQV